jgi:hypothetical protein
MGVADATHPGLLPMTSEQLSAAPKRVRVDIADTSRTGKWCRAFRCTPDELTDAVRAVGDGAQEVEQFLAQRRMEAPANR